VRITPAIGAFAALTLLSVARPVDARVTRIVIEESGPLVGGAVFGDTGPYERLRGHVDLEVDPSDPRNAVVFDLDKAPKNARGKVELSADFMMLRPADPARGNHTLFAEIPNRGHALSLALLHEAKAGTKSESLLNAEDLGNGFLLRRGYTVVWIGWQADALPGDGRIAVRFPIAMERAKPIRGRVVVEFSDRSMDDKKDEHAFSLPFGGRGYASYPAIADDAKSAHAVLHIRPSDSTRPSSGVVPEGEIVPADRWSFASCPNGPPGVPSATDLCLFDGFRHDRVYELAYDAEGSPVFGLGYVTTRDIVSFFRHAEKDESGNPNPARGVDAALAEGISQTGAYLRDFVYQGFNEDERGERVFDGMHIHVTGANKLGLNVRFSHNNWASIQHSNRLLADTTFPRGYAPRPRPEKAVNGAAVDGILRRPKSDPKILHSDTGNEWWNRRASLVDTLEDGSADAPQPENLRRYLISSLQHFTRRGKKPSFGPFERMCQQPSNVTHAGPIARALVDALDGWVKKGILPPESRVPRVADGTLISPAKYEALFPAIPGVARTSLVNGHAEYDFGPTMKNNRGFYERERPTLLTEHAVLVPLPDAIGNDKAGVRHPFIEAPIATLTGWSVRRAEFGEGEICGDNGQTIPLLATKAEREKAGDPRPSLEELYGDHAGYVAKVKAAAELLVKDRLMLAEDIDELVREADARDVLRAPSPAPSASSAPAATPPKSSCAFAPEPESEVGLVWLILAAALMRYRPRRIASITPLVRAAVSPVLGD
jgi:hypothetical protein